MVYGQSSMHTIQVCTNACQLKNYLKPMYKFVTPGRMSCFCDFFHFKEGLNIIFGAGMGHDMKVVRVIEKEEVTASHLLHASHSVCLCIENFLTLRYIEHCRM